MFRGSRMMRFVSAGETRRLVVPASTMNATFFRFSET